MPSEPAATAKLIARLRHMMVERDRDGLQRRDVHVKSHGVMRAEFSIEPDLADELRVGVFATLATYKAWVRFSSSANAINPDGARDIRGMAIKLIGVGGRKILEGNEDEQTQDFILISCPIFPTRDAAGFDGLVAAVIGSILHKLVYFLTHPRAGWVLLKTMVHHANPLQIRYWSAVPFLFGDKAVKWGVVPHVEQRDELPSDPPQNALRLAAVRQLAESDALFDFCVQFQHGARDMPVEDPRVEWSEAVSPMRKVATLRILRQDFDTDAQNAFGENLSFTPWHSLPEHRPLGSINRARKVLYETLSSLRHQLNQAPQREPTGWEL